MFDIEEFAYQIDRCKEAVKSRDERGYVRFTCGEMFEHSHGAVPFDYAEQRADVLVYVFPNGHYVLMRNRIGADLSSLNLEEHDKNDPHAEIRRAFEAGAKVEFYAKWDKSWKHATNPSWSAELQYRIAEEQTYPIIMEIDQIKEAVEQKIIYPTPTPILWWQKQATEQRAVREDIINLRNSIRYWHGIGS